MAIEKGLYAAPQGFEDDLEGGLDGVEEMDVSELEIEIVDPRVGYTRRR